MLQPSASSRQRIWGWTYNEMVVASTAPRCRGRSTATVARVSVAGEGGGSHFVPGTQNEFLLGVFGPPGFYLRNDTWSYDYDVGAHVRNGVAVGSATQEVVLNTTKLSWLTSAELFGARYGATVALTYVLDAEIFGECRQRPRRVHARNVDFRLFRSLCRAALAELGGRETALHVQAGAYAPTGTFDADNALNTSRNYWTGEIGGSLYLLRSANRVRGVGKFRLSQQLGEPGDELPFRRRGLSELDRRPALFEDFHGGVSGYFYSQIEADEGAVVGPLDASEHQGAELWPGPGRSVERACRRHLRRRHRQGAVRSRRD